MEADDDHAIDFLGRPRARQALVILREAETRGEPFLSAGEFETRILLTTRHAVRLRKYLLHWGLIGVEEGAEGKQLFVRIRLSAKGRRVADLLLQARHEVHGGDANLRQPSREKH